MQTNDWSCVEKEGPDGYTCPGLFKLSCPETPIESEAEPADVLNGADCVCENSNVLVKAGCREAFFCHSRLPNGGRTQTCAEGEIVDLDVASFNWNCQPDVGQCPSTMGGFSIGCGGGASLPDVPEPKCQFTTNQMGTCRCNGQLFISEDCTESFYCSLFAGADANGCHMKCENGEVVHLDVETRTWECLPPGDDYVCPGELQFDCQGGVTQCECEGQFW